MPTRVLWLTKGLGLGGAERLLTLMAGKLDGDDLEVDVAYLLPWKDAFVADLEAAGVRTVCLGARRTTELGWPRRLRALLRERDYDVIHTHSPVPGAAARLLARDGAVLVHTEHNVWDRYRWPTYAINAVTYGRNAAVLAVSDGVAESIQRPRWARFGTAPEVETLLHGVEPDLAPRGAQARASARATLALDEHRPVIGNVANHTPKKDHAGLLAALERVRARVPEVLLLLIGTGPLEVELRRVVQQRGLTDHVRFLGSRDDVPELLPALDVFVLSSRFEGLPISMLEAMAAEVACVVTRVGGIPEAITDGQHGRLVPPGDPEQLAGALVEVLEDDALRARLAAAGRQRVTASFSIDRAVQRTRSLYHTLLRNHGDHA